MRKAVADSHSISLSLSLCLLRCFSSALAGKSWTMTGSVTGDQRGIIPRSVEKVLEQSQALSASGWTYVLEASYLEI